MKHIRFKVGDKIVPVYQPNSDISYSLSMYMKLRKYLTVVDINSYTGQIGFKPNEGPTLYVPHFYFTHYKEPTNNHFPEELFTL